MESAQRSETPTVSSEPSPKPSSIANAASTSAPSASIAIATAAATTSSTVPGDGSSVQDFTLPPVLESATTSTAPDETAIQNRKLVEEFQYLLEKSQSLFSGLRDLPPTGNHRQWRPYFEKTFEVYTKLWKFQQTHRHVLEDKSNYGLKRWEVGEIASKIGQLYYHYYLRTSDTSYLREAYVFYDAIHERQYFKDILEVKNSALMIKKMRYYARFTVVSLLLNKDDKIRILMSELEDLVDEYTKSFKPPDAKEWQAVLDEINTFMEAEKKLAPMNADRTPVPIVHRLSSTSAIGEREGVPKLRLQEAILVGNCQKQIKFSELTLDMYRILQSLEMEPQSQLRPEVQTKSPDQATPSEITAAKDESGVPKDAQASKTGIVTPTVVTNIKRSNPHKYLLYKPSLSQLFVYISTAFKDTGENGVLFLYLSADGCDYPNPPVPGYNGGLIASQRKVSSAQTTPSSAAAKASDATATLPSTPPVNCLHPADLVPFTRKPLFVIIDSNNSLAFKNIPNVFDQPLLCLLSPIEYPSSVQDRSEIGSLFTVFLHTPLLGFCSVSDIGNLDRVKWDTCVSLIDTMETRIGSLLMDSPDIAVNIKRFMTDEFLYKFIVRFVLCSIIMRRHSSFKEEKSYPTSLPPLPESIFSVPEIIALLHQLTVVAEVGTYFSLPFASEVPLEP